MNISFKLLTLILALGGIIPAYSMEIPVAEAPASIEGYLLRTSTQIPLLGLIYAAHWHAREVLECHYKEYSDAFISIDGNESNGEADQAQRIEFTCGTCAKQFGSQHALDIHSGRMKHKKNQQREIAEVTAPHPVGITKKTSYTKLTDQSTKFACDMCAGEFDSHRALRMHIMRKHKINNRTTAAIQIPHEGEGIMIAPGEQPVRDLDLDAMLDEEVTVEDDYDMNFQIRASALRIE